MPNRPKFTGWGAPHRIDDSYADGFLKGAPAFLAQNREWITIWHDFTESVFSEGIDNQAAGNENVLGSWAHLDIGTVVSSTIDIDSNMHGGGIEIDMAAEAADIGRSIYIPAAPDGSGTGGGCGIPLRVWNESADPDDRRSTFVEFSVSCQSAGTWDDTDWAFGIAETDPGNPTALLTTAGAVETSNRTDYACIRHLAGTDVVTLDAKSTTSAAMSETLTLGSAPSTWDTGKYAFRTFGIEISLGRIVTAYTGPTNQVRKYESIDLGAGDEMLANGNYTCHGAFVSGGVNQAYYIDYVLAAAPRR